MEFLTISSLDIYIYIYIYICVCMCVSYNFPVAFSCAHNIPWPRDEATWVAGTKFESYNALITSWLLSAVRLWRIAESVVDNMKNTLLDLMTRHELPNRKFLLAPFGCKKHFLWSHNFKHVAS